MASICDDVFFAQSAHDLSWRHKDNLDLLDKINTAIKNASSEGRFSTVFEIPATANSSVFIEELIWRGFTAHIDCIKRIGECSEKVIAIEWHAVQPE